MEYATRMRMRRCCLLADFGKIRWATERTVRANVAVHSAFDFLYSERLIGQQEFYRSGFHSCFSNKSLFRKVYVLRKFTATNLSVRKVLKSKEQF
jgi:hypothetical protein